MKLTNNQLRQIIKEELNNVLYEGEADPVHTVLNDLMDKVYDDEEKTGKSRRQETNYIRAVKNVSAMIMNDVEPKHLNIIGNWNRLGLDVFADRYGITEHPGWKVWKEKTQNYKPQTKEENYKYQRNWGDAVEAGIRSYLDVTDEVYERPINNNF
jgi:hypothetical protein